MRLPPSSCQSDPMKPDEESIIEAAQQYRDEGYEVIIEPKGDALPDFITGYSPDIIARKPGDNVVAEVKQTRFNLESDSKLASLADIVNAQPTWRFDLVIVQPESTVEKVIERGREPDDLQIVQWLRDAERLSQDHPYMGYVAAWGALEAAMRSIRYQYELYGRIIPNELMRTIYSNGLIDFDEFNDLRASYAHRSQLVHGLVPTTPDPPPVGRITFIARKILGGEVLDVNDENQLKLWASMFGVSEDELLIVTGTAGTTFSGLQTALGK